MSDSTKNILTTYLNRLTNLSGNNRSLLLLKLHAEQTIDVHAMNRLNGENSFSVINALLGNKPIKLCQVLDSRVESNNEVSVRLKRMQRIDNFIFEERGSKDLHVGWPWVRGKFTDGTIVRAPLLFFPVTLHQVNNDWVLYAREDAGISFNKSFLLAYAFYNKVAVPDYLMEANFEDFNDDSTVFRTELYQLLKDKIEVNFNPDNFRDELIPFKEFKKEEFEETHRNGGIKLFPEAVLGIFPQAGSQLVSDYLHLIQDENFTDLENFFINRNVNQKRKPVTGSEDENEDAASADDRENQVEEVLIKEEKLYAPFLLDAWQENALKTVKVGRSIVVQGPPGTGKSQLICNLIADSVASGKRVLLVCQKRAALDVVYNRLHEIELSDFVGLIHDFRNDRKEIYGKISKQIDRVGDYEIRNRGVDIIQMERRFFQMSRRIDAITEEFDEFRQVLFDERECGLAVKELYLTSDLSAETINIKQEYQHFRFDNLDDFLQKLRHFVGYAQRYEHLHYVWRMRKSFARLKAADMKSLMNTVQDIPHYQQLIAEKISALIPVQLNLEDCETFLAREDDMLGMISVLKDDEVYYYFQHMAEESDEETSLLWLSNVERVCLNCYQGAGPEISLSAEQLGNFQLALHQRMDSRRNIIRRIRWELSSEHKFWIKRVLVANGLQYNRADLHVLEEKLDNRLNLEHHLTALKSKSWLADLPTDYQKDSLINWFEKKKLAIRAKIIFNSLREVKEGIVIQKIKRQEFVQLIKKLLAIVKDVPTKRKDWLKDLTSYQIRQLIVEPSIEKEYTSTLKQHFDDLCEFDVLKESLSSDEAAIINKLYDLIHEWDYEKMESVFQNSLRLAWIDYIETKYPILRIVSSMKMETLQAELQHLVHEKQRLSKEILLLRAREHVYEAIEYNRLRNRVTYRDLHHQVNKKKKIWPVRKVMHEFQDDIFRLIPCWMASPEAVSAIFPMRELFDLVIFDEASQCFAERGIPAIYRGHQLVVAGDDKQLKPYELYQVRWMEETDEPELEVDSLLNLAERYLETVYLHGHYRSHSVELIDFSNRYFYEGKLQLLPDRHVINRHEPAIEYCKVDGVWENKANKQEAEIVVERTLQLLQENPEKEIGIVTFNAPQQVCIMDLLEHHARTAGIPVPSSLFVKNIENVQGDEKDIILFSVGYAPDKRGKLSIQFGSLNAAGGENRLNVAITRAREKVIVVSSIWPEQLNTKDSKNNGPQYLKAYLEFARHVHEREFKPRIPERQQQRSPWYLKEKLIAWGDGRINDVSFQANALPFSDLHFSSNGDFLGIILTDDERYLNSLSIKDAHAYTPALLRLKNWEYKMIFSRNFWLDPEKVENDLLWLVGTQKG